VTITRLESRIDRLFGRETDLTQLLQWTQRSGLTAIVGPPQIGKSWLLMELAYRLDRGANPRYLVGFTRSPKGANDPLLQVVSDLYQRWLVDARAWGQLRVVWEQQKDGLLPAFARFVGKLSEKAAKLVPILGELGGTAIRESLEGLVSASEDLRSGRLVVSRLEYCQAQELVSSVQKISGQRISLVMDQWEETRDLDQQRNIFRDFLREPGQWPDCHILLGAREGGEAAELLHDLEADYPGGVHVHTLGEMDLVDGIERGRLISYLQAQPQLRALENVPDDRVLELVAGYPRVINRWTAEDARETAKTFDGLAQLAQDANAFRYRDLEKLLLNLDGDRRKLAARIALIPLVEAGDAWAALRPILLMKLDSNALDDLKLSNVLDKGIAVPRFGHQTRRDAARSFLDARRPEAMRAEAKYLIFALARSVTTLDTRTISFGEALRGLRDKAAQYDLGSLPLALCEIARTLFSERPSSLVPVIAGVQQARRSREAGLGFILSAGLFNMLIYAKAEGDLARRDALLDELHALARTFPDDAAVRHWLARGLFSRLIYAKAEGDLARRDALLDELHALARTFPDDPAVRQWLASVLLNTLNDAKAEDDLAHRDALLDELRALARTFPDDPAVRDQLARGLLSTLNDAKAEDDLARRDALLDELHDIARTFPDDPAVRDHLARGLFDTLNHATAEDELVRRDALLDELRDLARTFPDDAAVRRGLASGLLDTLNDAKAKNDLARRDALLDELRALARTFPDDAAVRRGLARGLLNTLIDAKAEDDLARRDALLDELRALAYTFPDDAADQLARGLFNTLNDAKAVDDRPRRDALLDELRALAHTFPDDAAVRQGLARGLFSTLNDAKTEGDLARRDALLYELRALARTFPDDAVMREWLARSLLITLVYAKAEDDLARRDALLDELCDLARTYPDDAAVRDQLACGLFNTLNDAKAEDDRTRRDALLDELRALGRTFPDSAVICEWLARGLFNTLNDARAEGDLARRDALLDELRALAHTFPDDAAVRQGLARGLFSTLNDAKAEGDLVRRDALLASCAPSLEPFPMTPPCATS
jgi:hypothetical protein